MPAQTQLAPIPAGLSLADLTTAVNDRIRRINTALGELASAPPLNAGLPVPGHVPKWDNDGNLVDSGHA